MTFLFFTSSCSCSEYLSFVVAIIIICFWHLPKANDANNDWNGFLFRLDRTRFFIWIDHNDSPTVCSIKCYFICFGFALLWNFFLRASPWSEWSVELRSFRFLLLFFCSWCLNTPYTETIFELSPPQTPDFSVVSRHSQPIFPNCDSFPTKRY